ncbi:MAG: ABC-2 transporter permease [Steroidobacteraceae bacterium]
MSRFFWLVRREIWEHKAIWVAPLIVLACFLLAVITGNVHLGPIGAMDTSTTFGALPPEKQLKLLLVVYAGLALVVYWVMGIIAFFYSLDSLYADRRDRSVLFWKSLPLSDAETVLSKFSVAVVVIPLVAILGALLAQLIVASGGAARLEIAGIPGGIMWQPEALLGGAAVAALWCVTASLWYAPIVAYLMLASAWAPKGPFLWAVLPPVALKVLELVLLRTRHVGDFISDRLFGLYRLLGEQDQAAAAASNHEVRDEIIKISNIDLAASLKEFYSSPELWFGVAAAGLLLAAAMWVRRYRDETT